MFFMEVPVVQSLSPQEMNTATQVQILDDTDCISHSTNTLGKGMNPIILPPAMGKQQDRIGSSALVRQLVQEKENSEFKPVKLRLKIDLVSYPVRAEGLVNSIIYQNNATSQQITSLLLNIVTLFINSNILPSNENMYPGFVKFC